MNVLITGSSSGFGRLTVESLLKEGFTVFATMIGVETFSAEVVSELTNFANNQPGTLYVLELDVANDQSVINAVDKAMTMAGTIDVVVNNAGIGGTGWTEAFTERQSAKMFDVNVFGVQRVMRAVLPVMRSKGKGLIINLSSIQGRVVFPYSGIYTASKFAVEGLTESYHYELAPLGVDVVMLQPGGFKTNFETVQSGPADADRLDSYADLVNKPDQIWGVPGEAKDFLPEPQPVPDAIIKLIETPHGMRPLRTVVDPLLGGDGPRSINEACKKAQKDLSDKLDWGIL